MSAPHPAPLRPPQPPLRGPWLVLAVGVAASLLAVVLGDLRLGGYLLSLSFVLVAAVRLMLPTRLVGAVAVRSRATDVVGMAVAGVAVAVLTATLKLTA